MSIKFLLLGGGGLGGGGGADFIFNGREDFSELRRGNAPLSANGQFSDTPPRPKTTPLKRPMKDHAI